MTREAATADRVRSLMREIGRACREPATAYLTGGATAVLHGWRETTIDVDLVFEPDRDEIYRAVRDLKDRLRVNVEIASPAHFLPEIPGWRDRSPFVAQEGLLTVRHYDLRAQALAKIERGTETDLADVRAMLDRSLVRPDEIREALAAIEPSLHRYPAVDPPSLRRAVEEVLEER